MNDDDIIIIPASGAAPRPSRGWVMPVVGIAFVMIGIGMLLWPFGAASWILSLLVGLAFVTSGAGSLLSDQPGSTGLGILMIVAGVLAITFSAFTAQILVALLGILTIALGVILFLLGASFRTIGLVVAGVILAALGTVALLWQEVALAVFAVALGLVALALGVWLIALSLRVRRR